MFRSLSFDRELFILTVHTGMQSLWFVGDAADIIKIPLEQSQSYLTYGGDVYGTVSHSPSVYEYFNGTNKCGAAGQQSANLTRRAAY